MDVSGRSSDDTTSAWYRPRAIAKSTIPMAIPMGSHRACFPQSYQTLQPSYLKCEKAADTSTPSFGMMMARKVTKAATSTTPVPSVWRRRNPRSMNASVTARAGGHRTSMGARVAAGMPSGIASGLYLLVRVGHQMGRWEGV